ncbi:hypothetical protein [Nocardia nova]|uniref:hypothetical protein n=1 Tax=Nocardia nova TaxID=37330 RepID=UPI0015E3A172|nr:hypothetical protein [Nocardia nova]
MRGRVPARRSGAVRDDAVRSETGPDIPTLQLIPETGLSSIPCGWLLPELPTALLIAVFVGTGWVGYAASDRPIPDPPLTVVVAPGDRDTLSVTFGDR